MTTLEQKMNYKNMHRQEEIEKEKIEKKISEKKENRLIELNEDEVRKITNKKELVMDLCDISDVDDCIEIIWDYDLTKEELGRILK